MLSHSQGVELARKGEGERWKEQEQRWKEQCNRMTCLGSSKYFLDTGASHMRQDIVDDETREEGVATSWNDLNAILKSVDPNQLVMVSKETAHVPPSSLSIPKVDIINSY